MTHQTLRADNLAIRPNKHIHDCRPLDVRLPDRSEDVLLVRRSHLHLVRREQLDFVLGLTQQFAAVLARWLNALPGCQSAKGL